MSSNAEQSSPPAQSKAKQKQSAAIPFANWPTIKILNPPKGRFSPGTDERCLIYCSQSVTGRFHKKEPYCRSICIRKVFTHEVRNVISFHTHHNLDAEGKARYPLPKEGQSANLPTYFGGHSPDDPDDQSSRPPPRDNIKYWDEGWYLWTSKSAQGAWEKLVNMRRDFESQQQFEAAKEKRRQDWKEYQDYRKANQTTNRTQPDSSSSDKQGEAIPDRWWGPIVPPPPLQDISAESLLIPLPPPIPPVYPKVENLLAPTHNLLGILHESITSGAQRQFALKIWEKAWSKDPYILAGRAFSLLWDKWGGTSDDNDEKRGST